MKCFSKVLLSIVLLLSIPTMGQVHSVIKLNLNSSDGIYSKGDKVLITASCKGTSADSLSVKLYKNGYPIDEYSLPFSNQVAIIDSSFNSTAAYFVEVGMKKGNFMPKQSLGFVVEPDGFKTGYQKPKDFNLYWKRLKKELESLKMQATLKPLEVSDKDRGNIECFDVEINCLGPKPVRGYLAKPTNAKEKSLPIVILFRAAGVSGAWCRCQVGECVDNAKRGNGAISFDINAHGMLNGQPNEYYQTLERGELSNYWHKGISNKDDYYFKWMYLRALRAIEYLTTLPEWDGKTILVIGESQGGGQAAAVAGLDKRVTNVVLHVPAMLDFGGYKENRLSGWPQPKESNRGVDLEKLEAVLPYYDAALLLSGSKAEVHIEIGLIDTTCPASALFSAVNGLKGGVIVNAVPYRSHQWPSGEYRTIWEQGVAKSRQTYINAVLSR